MSVISAMTGSVAELQKQSCSPGQPGEKARLYLKNNQAKRISGVAQVVERLLSKRDVNFKPL
jgi:hypothetical protein